MPMPMPLASVASARQLKEGDPHNLEAVGDLFFPSSPIQNPSNFTVMLNEQNSTHHVVYPGEVGRGFECPVCKQNATTRCSLKRHMRKHTGERPYRCQYCPYGAIQKSDLDKHIRRKHRSIGTAPIARNGSHLRR